MSAGRRHTNGRGLQGFLGLTPVLVLLGTFLFVSVLAGSSNEVPISVAFVVASVYGVCILRGRTIDARMSVFSSGILRGNILLMVWIFILAGMFTSMASSIGAVDVTVALTLDVVPARFLPAGIFLASCLLSMVIGTSVGTIVALTPVVSGIAIETDANTAWMVAIVVGGAFFGDNLSFISDTTIAATQSQGCGMRDKFWANLKVVLPASVIVLIYYATQSLESGVEFSDYNRWLSVPYLLVIVLSLTGMNVLPVLLSGILATILTGVMNGNSFVGIIQASGEGIASMSELIVITMLAGGLMGVINELGGFKLLLELMTRHVSSSRAAQLSIVILTAVTNLCTANNTIAIITTGDIARTIASKYNIEPKRMASILDTSSCIVQGLLPYGAQLLMAASLASISPVNIIQFNFYQFALAAMLIVSIIFSRRQPLSNSEHIR